MSRVSAPSIIESTGKGVKVKRGGNLAQALSIRNVLVSGLATRAYGGLPPLRIATGTAATSVKLVSEAGHTHGVGRSKGNVHPALCASRGLIRPLAQQVF